MTNDEFRQRVATALGVTFDLIKRGKVFHNRGRVWVEVHPSDKVGNMEVNARDISGLTA